MRVPYGIFHKCSYQLISTQSQAQGLPQKNVKGHFNCQVFCFSQICREGPCTATATQQRGPKGLDRTAYSSSPGQALVGWDKNTRLTVPGAENAGRGKGTTGGVWRDSTKQSNCVFTTAGTAFLHFNLALPEPSRGLCFCSPPYPRHLRSLPSLCRLDTDL